MGDKNMCTRPQTEQGARIWKTHPGGVDGKSNQNKIGQFEQNTSNCNPFGLEWVTDRLVFKMPLR